MKKAIVIAISVCFLFLSSVPISAFEIPRHNGEIGVAISHITYKEPDFDLKEKGMMYGLEGAYTYHNRVMLRIEGKGSFGSLDYSSQSGEIDDITDYMLEARILGGYDFPVSGSFMVTPYIGFGYRYLNDDLSGKISTRGAIGYERESNYYYSPIGLMAWAQLGYGWRMAIKGEYDYLWEGRQKTHWGDAIAGFPTVENRQETGYGLRGSVKFQKRFATAGLSIEPFIRYWTIDRSENEYFSARGYRFYSYEPKNDSTEFGLILSVIF